MTDKRMDRNAFPETPAVVHDAVLSAFERLPAKAARRPASVRFTRAAVLAACVCLISATALAAGAIISYRQRMEIMTEEQLTACYDIAGSAETTLYSRELTEDEKTRMEALTLEYEQKGVFPEATLAVLDGEAWSGSGLALDAGTRTLCLPDENLSDEALLQIIDYDHSTAYSIYRHAEEVRTGENDWMRRLAALDSAELDRIYLAAFSGAGEISGGYSRSLTEAETVRYAEFTAEYEEKGAVPENEAAVIAAPEEYAGSGAAICAADGTYYLPEAEMEDEALLQLIDFEHKASYAISKIGEEIDLGLRAGWPAKGE